MTGKPLIYCLVFGLQKPKHPIIGSDIAGRVETVGRNVKRFQSGDEIFGDISGCDFGAFDEYVCAREEVLALKPAGMTFAKVATVPQAGILALQGLPQGQIKKGQKVLINGAGGGVGTFAVQMAKSWGAEVTGVDSREKLDLLRSLGADTVVDYTQEDFIKNGRHYDLILDVVAHRSIFDYKRTLSSGGILVIVGDSIAAIFQAVILGTWFSKTGPKKRGILAHKPNASDLELMKELIESGKVVPVIDRCYPLSEVA